MKTYFVKRRRFNRERSKKEPNAIDFQKVRSILRDFVRKNKKILLEASHGK